MIDLEEIRTYARQLHRHGVDALELQEDDRLLRIRVDRHPAAAPSDGATAASAPDAGLVTVRSTGLGLFRPADPATGPGAAVRRGQLLARLELDPCPTDIAAPADGVIVAVLAEAGQRVDYGMPLFHLQPSGES
ncbi:acetyl-CoA carboxylase biotin carboxyl carrier protein [Bordetella bronchiseptica]|uniref:acetyl-CoA carboxylase biotin carboxyl carrier protein n=1 Tax=Bordetella bronchiseptica TaxID=518 RepID=UPI000461F588|nr:biotin/lipoyl-containing protein [Bordetella bronchiseptica]KDC46704.1 biotin-requiring enzyme [Bordetella bronchiseptica M85/00/2]